MAGESMMKIGIIGGSGLYNMQDLKVIEELPALTPFGQASDNIIHGTLWGKDVYFLPRHGRGHRRAPHEINYRANIYALKQVGVQFIVSVSAVGSMKEEIAPGDLVFPDQFIDRTRMRPSTFFENGIVAHVSFGDPVCSVLQNSLADAAQRLGLRSHRNGTYICIDGPQFSTRAESLSYRALGVDVIGMTNVTEAKLAREAEISYATMALATDYDCWHVGEEAVTVEAVVKTLHQNVANAQKVISELVKTFTYRETPSHSALKNAIMTDPAAVPVEARQRLALLLQNRLG